MKHIQEEIIENGRDEFQNEERTGTFNAMEEGAYLTADVENDEKTEIVNADISFSSVLLCIFRDVAELCYNTDIPHAADLLEVQDTLLRMSW